MAPDLSTWVTKQAAADAIGVSTKTVEQMTADHKLEAALYRRPGGGARIRVYNPDDVARLAQARRTEPAPFVLAPDAGQQLQPAGRALEATAESPSADAALHTLLAAALRIATSENLLRSDPTPAKLWVDLSEAAVITGLPAPVCRRLIRRRKLEVVRSCAGWWVRRRDVEGL